MPFFFFFFFNIKPNTTTFYKKKLKWILDKMTLYPNIWKLYKRIGSIRRDSVSNFLIWWLHHTNIKTPFALQSPTSALSVGCSGDVGRSASISKIGHGDFLHTPTSHRVTTLIDGWKYINFKSCYNSHLLRNSYYISF